MVTRELLGIADIAEALGVSERRARQITRSYRDFPLPEVEHGHVRLWASRWVELWIGRHGSRTVGRPPRVDGLRRARLARLVATWMSSSGTTSATLALGLGVPDSFIDALVAVEVDDASWPGPSFLRQLAMVFGKHPALALDAAGYAEEARIERSTFGESNDRTRRIADEVRRPQDE